MRSSRKVTPIVQVHDMRFDIFVFVLEKRFGGWGFRHCDTAHSTARINAHDGGPVALKLEYPESRRRLSPFPGLYLTFPIWSEMETTCS